MFETEKWKQIATDLKPKMLEEVVSPVSGLDGQSMKQGDYTILDFGNHFVGEFSFTCTFTGSHPDAPVLLRIKLCESKRELEESSEDYHGWVSKSWVQEEYLHLDEVPGEYALSRRFAFRYVKIEILAISDKFSLCINGAHVLAQSSGDIQKVQRVTGPKMKQAIDRIAIRTLHNCMQEVFEDGPKRDRRLWVGDLRLEALVNYCTFKNNDLVRRCLYMFAAGTDQNGRVPACVFDFPTLEGDDTYLFDYSLLYIVTLLDYVNETGDMETAKDLLPVAMRQYELSVEEVGKDGVVRDRDELGWCLLDWNMDLNRQAGAQFVLILGAKALCELIEKTETEDAYPLAKIRETIDRLEKAAKENLWNEKTGFFESGDARQVSVATQVWAVLSGMLSEQEARDLMSRVTKNLDTSDMTTPYIHSYYVMALLNCGMKREAEEHILSYWGGMAEDGADTFYEMFRPDDPDFSPYGSSIVNSYCHGWGCSPAYFFRRCDV
ncbi:MAG: hypothetical protein K5853_07305 [Lachnospiraceae bacterium]|nr:hypothetical protein [Lachnospiraceae bacterium]